MNLLAQHKDILEKISSQEKSFKMQEILEETFFANNKNCALIIQNINRYAVLYCKGTIYNKVREYNTFISSFWKLITFIKYLKDNEYIYSLGDALTNRELQIISLDFQTIKLENDKIILNKKGWYTNNPEAIFDKSDSLIYRGTVYKSDFYNVIMRNLFGVYIASDKFKELLSSKKETQKKKLSSLSIISDFASISNFLITAILVTFFYLNYDFNNQSLISKKYKKAHSNSSKINYGIDISHYQSDLLHEGLPDSISFVICKATEGVNYTDSDFKKNWKYLKNKDIKRGAYHFYKSNDSPTKQASHFLETLKSNKYLPNDISPILDIERMSLSNNSTIDIDLLNKDILTFLKYIESKTSKIPLIYTNSNFADQYLINDHLTKYPLWIADYNKDSTPKIPQLWKDKGYLIWQKTDTYYIKSKTIDLDEYRGNINDLTY